MWCFMASKYKNKVFFRDMSPEIWLDYANYILGDKCYLMQVPTPGKGGKGMSDLAALRPPWIVILNYEYEMRREAVKRASRESRPLRETLTEVMKDFQLKEQYFTAPIALSSHSNTNLTFTSRVGPCSLLPSTNWRKLCRQCFGFPVREESATSVLWRRFSLPQPPLNEMVMCATLTNSCKLP